MTLQRRDLIGFERIQAFDRRDHVVAKSQAMNTFEVKGGLLEVGAKKHAHQVALRDFFLFHFRLR